MFNSKKDYDLLDKTNWTMSYINDDIIISNTNNITGLPIISYDPVIINDMKYDLTKVSSLENGLNLTDYGYKYDKNKNVLILLPISLPQYDPYIRCNRYGNLSIFMMKGDDIEKIEFYVDYNIEKVYIDYDNISYDNIMNKKIKIGFITMDTDNGYCNDHIYINK